jgi:hypothetical protein
LILLTLSVACGGVNEAGDEVCESGLTDCGGECLDTTNDEANCGGCDIACGAEQACIASTCEDFSSFVTAQFDTTPRDPTGWVFTDGSPLSFDIVPVDVDGVTYECRTGPAMMIGSVAFSACDGADGTGTTHTPAPNPAMEEGSYQTEMRVRIGDFISDPVVFEFYAHRSLDSAATCPQTLTDDEIFTAAGVELLAGNPPAFGANTVTRNPFVTLPFTNIQPSNATQVTGSFWQNRRNTNFTVQARSLRRRFALSANGQLILVQRQYVSRRALDAGETEIERLCRNGISYQIVTDGIHRDAKLDCHTMVLNSSGASRCVRDDGGNPVVEMPSTNGFIKINRKMMFSPKGANTTCPSNLFNPGACIFDYLVLPM